jgi:integrase
MKSEFKLPYLSNHNGTYVFRRRIPERFQSRAGRVEWKLALGRVGGDAQRIRVELRVLTEATDEAIAALARGQLIDAELLERSIRKLYPTQHKPLSPSLRDAVDDYLKYHGLSAPRKPEQMALQQFLEFSSKHRVDEIRRSDVRSWLIWLVTERQQSAATVRRRLGAMRAIFNHAIDAFELELPNPFARHKLRGGETGTERQSFQAEHLLLIDNWLRAGHGDETTGLILRLLRLTGARPLEIGGLEKGDLELDAHTPVLFLRPNQRRGLKTRSASRIVPLVGDALEAARTAYGLARGEALFPTTCHQTGSLSARLNKAIRAAGVPRRPGLTAYSFRHTVEDALRLTGAPYEVQQAVLGHAPRSITDRYGSRRVPVNRVAEALLTVSSLIAAH